MNRLFHQAAFATGLAAIAWVAASYFPGNLLALTLVLVIGAFYLAGAWELRLFQRASDGLSAAVARADETPPVLADWLAPLDASLRQAVRLRVEGERVALPGPSLTPYLAGLLVLLGMLGTFLGMVVTLNGTGLALQNAVDIEAMRTSLVAPVKGLGLAFGTSVAGVAASAMLGLMSALARRDRQRAVQRLDARIATSLRGFSRAHQREESLRLARSQADTMPALVAQLEALVATMAQQGAALQNRLVDQQAAFQGEAQRAYAGLAESVDRSLKASLVESARLAGAAIEPAVQATMAGLVREASGVREAVTAAVQQQVDGVGQRLDAAAVMLTDRWQTALADQQREHTALTQGLAAGLDRFATTFDQRAGALVDGVTAQLDRSADVWTASWGDALARQQQGHDTLATHTRDTLATTLAGFDTLAERWQAALADQQGQHQALTDGLAAGLDRFTSGFEQRSGALIDGVTAQMDRSAGLWTASWSDALARQQAGHDTLTTHTRDTLSSTLAGFDTFAESLRRGAAEAQAAWETAAAARETERLTAFHDGLSRVTATLKQQGEHDAAALAERQQQICTTLERTAQAITEQAGTQARSTLGEIAHLMQAASDAPRAAAEVIGELRQALSDSLVRDNTALDERNRLLSTLSGLLDAVNHASTEQRAAIDTLVQSTTDVLERVGARFADTVETEARSLAAVSEQVAGGASEVASLGEGFGSAVQLFSQSSEQLMAQLQRIEAALGHSLARSDEQLAYYVAQAREIVDLTLGSHKQVVDDLRRIGQAPAEAAPA